MISQQEHYGGCLWLANTNATLNILSPRLVVMKNASVGRFVQLPDATRLPLGGPHYVIINDGSQSIQVRDASSSNILTLTADKGVTISLISNANAAGQWQTIVRDIATGTIVNNESRGMSIADLDNSPGTPEPVSCAIAEEPNILWQLTDCEGNEAPFVTTTNLSEYVGSVVQISSKNPSVCWSVTETTKGGSGEVVEEVEVTLDFEDCDECTGAGMGLPDCGDPPYDATITWHCASFTECQTQEQAIAEWEAFTGRTVSCVTIISQSDQSCGDGPFDATCPFVSAGVNYVPE